MAARPPGEEEAATGALDIEMHEDGKTGDQEEVKGGFGQALVVAEAEGEGVEDDVDQVKRIAGLSEQDKKRSRQQAGEYVVFCQAEQQESVDRDEETVVEGDVRQVVSKRERERAVLSR